MVNGNNTLDPSGKSILGQSQGQSFHPQPGSSNLTDGGLATCDHGVDGLLLPVLAGKVTDYCPLPPQQVLIICP